MLRQLFTPEEASIMKRESIDIFDDIRGGETFSGKTAQEVQPFFQRNYFLSRIVEDDRIYGIGESLLGPDFFLYLTEGNLHMCSNL